MTAKTAAGLAQLGGLVAIGIGLYLAWPPLAWVFGGLMAIVVARVGTDDGKQATGTEAGAEKDGTA